MISMLPMSRLTLEYKTGFISLEMPQFHPTRRRDRLGPAGRNRRGRSSRQRGRHPERCTSGWWSRTQTGTASCCSTDPRWSCFWRSWAHKWSRSTRYLDKPSFTHSSVYFQSYAAETTSALCCKDFLNSKISFVHAENKTRANVNNKMSKLR